MNNKILLSILLMSMDILNGDENSLKEDILIYFFNKDYMEGILFDLSNPVKLESFGFSPTNDTVIHIHGYLETVSSPICSSQTIKNAILSKYDVNMFLVSYKHQLSSDAYQFLVLEVDNFGGIVASLIEELVTHHEVKFKNIKMTGISLGAQVAGVAGTALDGQIEQLVGIDPAGPLFNVPQNPSRLQTSSAKFVQVIHTCAGRLGINKSIGHADYWVNGGVSQPACEFDVMGTCSHLISLSYYIESVFSNKFIAKQCDNYDKYRNGNCSEMQSIMGGFDVDKSAYGDYFLETNNVPPYAKG